MSTVFNAEPDFEDGTNVLVGTAFREVVFRGRGLPWYLPLKSEAPANWKERWGALRARTERLVDECQPAECSLYQTRMPAFGLETRVGKSQPGELWSGPGLESPAAHLFAPDGSPLAGVFPVRGADDKPMLTADGRPQAFRFGAYRHYIVSENARYRGDPRPMPDPKFIELARDGAALLYDLPAEVAVTVWKNWSKGFSRKGNDTESPWLDVLFELSWQSLPGSALSARRYARLGTGSIIRLVGDGLFPRLPSAKGFDVGNSLPNDGGHPMAWEAKLDDIARASVAAIDEILKRGTEAAKTPRLKPSTSVGKQPIILDSITMETDERKKVFISYSHDSAEHREKVLALSERLRADGIETVLDQYLNGSPPEGWPRWMLNQLDAADFVLVVCTENYYRRFRGHEQPGKGRGVDWEGALITQELYDSRSRTLKFVPMFLSAAVEKWIPEPLRSHSFYTLTSKNAYDSLYDLLLAQAGVEPGELGTPKQKPRRKAAPLSFDDPDPTPAPPRPPPMPPAPAISLVQVLVGRWQVQIHPPFAQAVMGQMNLDLFHNGLFRGQLINPMGVTGVEGQWQANPIQNQIALQGMQSNGFQVIPYAVMVQIASFGPHHLQGVTSGGEQVRWQRVNPPNTPPPLSPF